MLSSLTETSYRNYVIVFKISSRIFVYVQLDFTDLVTNNSHTSVALKDPPPVNANPTLSIFDCLVDTLYT